MLQTLFLINCVDAWFQKQLIIFMVGVGHICDGVGAVICSLILTAKFKSGHVSVMWY